MAGEIHFFAQTLEKTGGDKGKKQLTKQEIEQLRQTEDFFKLEGFVLGELFQLSVQEELSPQKEAQILEWMTCNNEMNREKMAEITSRYVKENKKTINAYEKDSEEYTDILKELAEEIVRELSFLEEESRRVA